MSDAPNLCPTCRTVITPKEAKEYQGLQARIEVLGGMVHKRGNDIAVLKSDLKKAQARIAELEALSNSLCDWLEGYGADLRKEPEIYRLLGREL